MKQTAKTNAEWEDEQREMKWVLEEMLPALQYFCNLEKLETAVLEEQEIEKKVPLLTQGDDTKGIPGSHGLRMSGKAGLH